MTTQSPSGNPPVDGMQYADALAAELIHYLGVDAAMRTCSENHWAGVLDAVRRQVATKSPSS